MDEKTFVTKRITNKDVFEKLEKQDQTLTEILEHAKETNGKIANAQIEIAKLNAKSIGVWVGNHPFKFAVFITALMTMLVSDSRDGVITLLKSLVI